jgi:site-specific recombinase XerD
VSGQLTWQETTLFDIALISNTDEMRDRMISLVLDSLGSPSSRRCYKSALQGFFAWYAKDERGPITKALVQQYRSHLQTHGYSSSTINQHLSAIRKLVSEAADNGLIDATLAAGIARIKSPRIRGVRFGHWLTADQAGVLINTPASETLKGKRDQAILALLIGAGLRREEATRMSFEELQLREERWVILDLIGKHSMRRTIPVPYWSKRLIDVWVQASGVTTGKLFRSVDKADRISGDHLSAQAIYDLVQEHAQNSLLKTSLSPHDLRRTYAHLAFAGNAPLEQIQFSLGHASIVTTERYLGTRQNLRRGPGDYIQLLQFAPKITDGYLKAMAKLRQTRQDHSQQEFDIQFSARDMASD